MSAPSDAERAREITRGWFRADNEERVMDDLHDRIAAALSAARAEGRAEGISAALDAVNGIDGPLLPHEKRAGSAQQPDEDTQGIRADGVAVARYAIEAIQGRRK